MFLNILQVLTASNCFVFKLHVIPKVEIRNIQIRLTLHTYKATQDVRMIILAMAPTAPAIEAISIVDLLSVVLPSVLSSVSSVLSTVVPIVVSTETSQHVSNNLLYP